MRLRERIAADELLTIHGAWDALTARMAAQAGAEAVYMSGSCVSSSVHGGPDVGLTTMTEMARRARQMADAIDVPLVADGDTGYGSALNVRRTVREYERAGVAAIQLEDQRFPKKCGHFEGKRVVDAPEFAAKVEAATEARESDEFLVIARTDALATHGIAEAISRARLYREAGADVLFVEAPTDEDQMRTITSAVEGPHLANMAAKGKTPPLSVEELAAVGYDVAIYPSDAFKAALRTIRTVYETVVAEGSRTSVLDEMVEWDERDDITRLDEWTALEERADERERAYAARYADLDADLD
ncbi:isocitrate lyase/PEP mutase family protein [Halomarina pelagica]|uniref:isocitrate lyase/PEP mutase family protein n=1 Tax=Halomarina pelagica TaxID=2961599 RepID=UPI0020C2D0DB|nr:isocitrate lyase/PEP mutase family protein [Halomarina sp. BND7]